MNIDEIFRSFFGFNRRNRDWRDPRDGNFHNRDDPDDDGDDDIFISFGFDPRQDGWVDNTFSDFHREMEQQMNEFNRQMEDMLHQFGNLQFSGIEGPRMQAPKNPRDLMLKEPDHETEKVRPVTSQSPTNTEVIPHQEEHRIRPPTLFQGFFGPRIIKFMESEDHKKEDGDLNSDRTSGDGKRFEDPDTKEISPVFPSRVPHHFSSSSASVSISTSHGADGKVETRKTVNNSGGRSETTVTRSIGDQSHSVTTRTDNSGQQEKIEHFSNMDEKDLQDFEQKWNSKTPEVDCRPCQLDPAGQDMVLPAKAESLIKKILDWTFFKPK